MLTKNDSWHALYWAGVFFSNHTFHNIADRYFKQALHYTRDWHVYYNSALLNMNTGQYGQAYNALQNAVAYFPAESDGNYNDSAIPLLEKAAEAAFLIGNAENALEYIHKILDIDQTNIKALQLQSTINGNK